MPQPCSDDCHTKLLDAYASGAGSLRQLAIQFRVSWGWAKKIRVQELRTGGKVRGLEKVDRLFVFSCAAHNLIRLPRLMAQPPETLQGQWI